MPGKDKFTIEERPETDVYTTASGFIGVKQVLRGEETVILLTVEEAKSVIGYLKACVEKLTKK